MLSVAHQSALAASLVDERVRGLGAAEGSEPTLPNLLLDAGVAPVVSRLPARLGPDF